MDWLHLGASSAPCTTTQQVSEFCISNVCKTPVLQDQESKPMHCHLQAPDPDERAVVMLKSRHLQLVSSLQQELEQLKQANQDQASYVSI